MQPIIKFKGNKTFLDFPVTLFFLTVNVGFYAFPSFSKSQVCLKLDEVLLFVSPFQHFDPTHISINMMVLIFEGIWLEWRLGGRLFFYLLLVFSVLSNLVFLLLEAVLHRKWPQEECVVGLSGVLFGLIVVKNHYAHEDYDDHGNHGNHDDHDGMADLGVVSVWNHFVVVVLLVMSCVVNPSSSLIANLAGILVGFLYTKGPLKNIIKMCAGEEPPRDRVLVQGRTPKPNVGLDRTQFVEKVSDTVLKQLRDQLLQEDVINDGENDAFDAEKTKADKARKVFDDVKKKGAGPYLVLCKALWKQDPHLFKEVSEFI